MTNFERVLGFVAEMNEVTIESIDGIISHIRLKIDSYSVNDDTLSFGDLNDNEIIIRADDIVHVVGREVTLEKYVLDF